MKRVALHPLGLDHAPFVESLYAHADVTRMLLRIQRPLSADEARALCDTRSARPGEHRFIAVLDDGEQPVGLGIVRVADGVATIGYSVLPSWWGQGVGTDLAQRLVEFARGTLGCLEVRATTLDGNAASARILTKLGFVVWTPTRARRILAGTSVASSAGRGADLLLASQTQPSAGPFKASRDNRRR